MATNAPYARALRWEPNADNATLVRWTTKAARDAWPCIPWSLKVPRAEVPRLVHAFAQDTVQYLREDGDQLIRMPWRTLEDGQGDCKSLAVLVGSLCAAAGCSVVLRFVAYPGEDWYGHVFAVVDGVPVDPELEYGEECLYSHHLDRRIR